MGVSHDDQGGDYGRRGSAAAGAGPSPSTFEMSDPLSAGALTQSDVEPRLLCMLHRVLDNCAGTQPSRSEIARLSRLPATRGAASCAFHATPRTFLGGYWGAPPPKRGTSAWLVVLILGIGFFGVLVAGAIVALVYRSSSASAANDASEAAIVAPVPPPPERVTVIFHGAMIAPTKANDVPWDPLPFMHRREEEMPSDFAGTLLTAMRHAPTPAAAYATALTPEIS